jgi:DNA-binding YbaB/EbfC family protein
MDFSKMGEMLAAAKDMKENLDAQLAETVLEAESGGGAVQVRINGKKELLKLTIAPSAAAAAGSDITMLEDLVVAAVNAAGLKADAAMESAGRSMLGGLKLPGL